MISNRISIEEITAADLVEMMRTMVAAEFKKLKPEPQPEKLHSPAETCKMFNPNISKVTLKKWSDEGKIQDHRIGGRIYYKNSEIIAALVTLRKYQK